MQISLLGVSFAKSEVIYLNHARLSGYSDEGSAEFQEESAARQYHWQVILAMCIIVNGR